MVSAAFSTPIDVVLSWEWLQTMEWYVDAQNMKTVDVYIQVKLSQMR